MAGNKYMTLNGGKKTLIKGQQTSAGVADANKIPALDATGKLDPSLLPTGVGPDLINVPSFENLDSGDYVNLFDDAGTVKARKADNSNNRPAHGYIAQTVTAPAAVNVFFEGANAGLSGLTEGARIYLGTTGDIIETPLDPDVPANDGKLHQFLGVAISETEVNTDIADCIIL